MRRISLAIAAAVLGLVGSLGATLALHRAASRALDQVLEERLRGAGETASSVFARTAPDAPALRAVMAANGLEGAYVVDGDLRVLADGTGPAGGRADLLRVDRARVRAALSGRATVAFAYAVGDQPIATGYFPIGAPPSSVLALEAGQAFAGARAGLARALWVGVGVSALGAAALAGVALVWARSEARRRRDAERAARGDALARMGAMVAHEIRNPLGVIRGAVELVGARSGASLPDRDRAALADVVGEVERLRVLTDDFLDLARDPRIVTGPLDLAAVVAEAVRAVGVTHGGLAVEADVPALPVEGDAGRLRQVILNLLVNAAQAGATRVSIQGERIAGRARLLVQDDGPGIPAELRDRLFEVFATARAGGTGLGLALSRRIVERHGGTLRLASEGPPGAAFELSLPLAAR